MRVVTLGVAISEQNLPQLTPRKGAVHVGLTNTASQLALLNSVLFARFDKHSVITVGNSAKILVMGSTSETFESVEFACFYNVFKVIPC